MLNKKGVRRMSLKIIRQDITKMEVDAIVNATNCSLLGDGGVDGCIHKAAGNLLMEECKKIGSCDIGDAKITKGYHLPCHYIIHTVGPRYVDGNHNEKDLLASCYRASLRLAQKFDCKTIAFPLISSGTYGYPKDEALSIAISVISEFLLKHDITIYLVIFDRDSFQISEKLFADITQYIDDRYVETSMKYSTYRKAEYCAQPTTKTHSADMGGTRDFFRSLKNLVSKIDETFSEMLLRKIDESGMTDAECYKKANIDRKLFSKIRSDKMYKPSKPTVIAFAIALELSLDETKDLLMKAGFALSHSNKFDLIIEYFIINQNYNIFEINEALFVFDQHLLGE